MCNFGRGYHEEQFCEIILNLDYGSGSGRDGVYKISYLELWQPLCLAEGKHQGSKIVLVRSYLRVSQAAGQVNILIFLLKIKFSPCMPINFVMQGNCLFSDISRPDHLCNFGRGHHSCEIILTLDQWFRRRCPFKEKFTDYGRTHDRRRPITIAHLELLAQVS